jgi:hypothetical protein
VCQYHLRYAIPSPIHLTQYLTIELRFLIAIWDLLEAAVEDQYDAMGMVAQIVFEDLGGEEFMVLPPEFPEEVRVPVGTLLHRRHMFHPAIEEEFHLFLFIRVEENLPTRVHQIDL